MSHMESEGYIHYRYSVYVVYLSINQRWQVEALADELRTTWQSYVYLQGNTYSFKKSTFMVIELYYAKLIS